LKFLRVTHNDVLVVQCNASNTHGYIFANAFLNVLGQCAILQLASLICVFGESGIVDSKTIVEGNDFATQLTVAMIVAVITVEN